MLYCMCVFSYMRVSMCVCVCVCVCACTTDWVFGSSENVQTVYKVRKLMYCAVMNMCVKIF